MGNVQEQPEELPRFLKELRESDKQSALFNLVCALESLNGIKSIHIGDEIHFIFEDGVVATIKKSGGNFKHWNLNE